MTTINLGLKKLVPINTDKITEEQFDALWEKVSKADYAFEDMLRGNRAAFAASMLVPNTYNFEIPGVVFAQLTNAFENSNAGIHFITLSEERTNILVNSASELFYFAFEVLKVHRITAFVPAFNQRVTRMATLSRMKFEGQLRKAFLYEKEWWDLQIYGLLDIEWARRG